MNTIPLWIIVAGVVVVAMLVLGAWHFFRRRNQSDRLQQRVRPGIRPNCRRAGRANEGRNGTQGSREARGAPQYHTIGAC